MPTVELDWTDERSLVVSRGDGFLHVVVHPQLSEGQIRVACEALGSDGAVVLEAWRGAMGLSPAR